MLAELLGKYKSVSDGDVIPTVKLCMKLFVMCALDIVCISHIVYVYDMCMSIMSFQCMYFGCFPVFFWWPQHLKPAELCVLFFFLWDCLDFRGGPEQFDSGNCRKFGKQDQNRRKGIG